VRRDAASRLDSQDVQMRALPESQQARLAMSPSVVIALHAPASVIALLEDAIESCRGPGEQRWKAFERVLAHAYLTWKAQPRHRDPIFERDAWTCQVPACTSRSNLNDHHLTFRSHGGDNDQSNRVTVCAAHHLYGIHRGIIRAHGEAPDHVVWETPLMRTLGDRYLDA